MNRFALVALATLILPAQACKLPSVGGGSSDGGLASEVSASTAPYAILDVLSGAVTYRAQLADVATNPAYRFDKIVFRRVGPDGAKVFIGIFEVTQAQWAALNGATISTPWTAVDPSVVQTVARNNVNPAYNIDYLTLTALLTNYAPSGGARLAVPSVAQWHYAVGANSGYSWGQTGSGAALAAQAVVRETVLDATTATVRSSGGLIDSGGPLACGSRAPSAQGIYDLHGNVWEWMAGGNEVRGGSWYDTASLARAEVSAGSGQGLDDDVDHALIGARLVLIP